MFVTHAMWQVMAWMEQCAYISASRMRAAHILTASMDSVTFARSTKVGDILYITSQVGLGGAAGGRREGGMKGQRAEGLIPGLVPHSGDILHVTGQVGCDGTQIQTGDPKDEEGIDEQRGRGEGNCLAQRALFCAWQGWELFSTSPAW